MGYYCENCEQDYGDMDRLKHHWDHSPAHNHECEECDMMYDIREALDVHTVAVHHHPMESIRKDGEGRRRSTAKNDRVCFRFAERRSCRFGLGCRYSHDVGVIDSSAEGSRRAEQRSEEHRQEGFCPVDHIETFFAGYANFEYDSTVPIWSEFDRMCRVFQWSTDEYQMRNARRDLKSAMVLQFNGLYGTDEHNLDSWQNLCRVLDITPVPKDLKKCRESVRQTNVNLVDLVEASRTGQAIKVFTDLKQLQDYTIETGKFFPKEDGKAGGLLKFLLREILHPK